MSRFTKLRMAIPTLSLSLLLMGVGGVAAWYVHGLQRQTSRELHRTWASVHAAEQLVIDFREARNQLHLMHLRETDQSTNIEEVERRRPDIQRWLSTADASAMTQQERSLIARIRRGSEDFFLVFDAMREDPDPDHVEPALQQLRGIVHDEILVPANQYLKSSAQLVDKSSERNAEIANWMALALLLLGTCGAVAGVLAGFGITRAITRSMVQLSVPVRDTAGKLSEVVGPMTLSTGWGFEHLQDDLEGITHRVGTVVERLQRSQRDALRAEQLAAVGQLAAGLAHELRNPLMSMKLLVQAAVTATGEENALRGRDLDVLNEEIERLEQLVQALLDYARPPQVEMRSFSLRALIEEVVQLLTGQAELQGARVRCDVPDDPVMMEADRGQLRQVLLNLLLNALDAVYEGGVVSLEVDPPEHAGNDNVPGSNRYVTIRVADTGRGLPEELGTRIFEPFVSNKETGTGLGLSICKRIVEAHGGTISGANRPHAGAVFTVRLPVAQAAGAAIPLYASQPA